MSSKFLLEVVTPDKSFFYGEIEMAIVRTTEGDIGIMNNHEPIVAPVSVGSIRIKEDNEFKNAACSGGFLTVDEEKVIIITDAAEWAEEIDVKRAEEAADRAARRLDERQAELDVLRAKVSMEKAMNRIRVSKSTMDHTSL